jgi:dienelactone hydrolase
MLRAFATIGLFLAGFGGLGSKATAAADDLRRSLVEMLGIPALGGPTHAESRGLVEHDGVVIEKWVFTAEPGSKVPALLFRPAKPAGKMPVVVFTYGHGSSKSAWPYQYAALAYAKLGLATLAIDPIGEEERHVDGRMGSRAHDNAQADARAAAAGRLIMGKLVFDTMRGIDWLATRDDIDMSRVAVAGYSLGGAKASWMAALDGRLRAALVCGWAYDDIVLPTKLCQKVPFTAMRKQADWPTFIGLAAPHCAIYLANGNVDAVIDRNDRGVWLRAQAQLDAARPRWAERPDRAPQSYLEPEAGHRPFFAYKEALEFLHGQGMLPGATEASLKSLPTIHAGQWCDRYRIELEKLYGTQLHWRGSTLVDLKIMPLAPAELAVLKPDERGSADFTLEGWLDRIEGKR